MELESQIHIAATVERTWEVLGDFGAVHRWVPALSDSSMLGGVSPEVGAVRVCQVPGLGEVRERILEWEPGHAFSYELAPRAPFASARNHWSLVPHPEGGCVVRTRASVELRFGALGRLLLHHVMRPSLERAGRETLVSLAHFVERGGALRPGASRDPRATSLRLAFGANVAFSLVSALVFLFASGSIAAALALPSTLVVAVAAALTIFGAFVGLEVFRPRPRPRRALLIIVSDVSWVLGSVAFVTLRADVMSSAAVLGTLGIAGVVGVFGAAQLFGLLRSFRTPAGHSERARHCVAIRVDAPPGLLWSRVSDLGDIARHSAALSNSELVGSGVGAVRRCEDLAGKVWREEVTRLDEVRREVDLRFRAEEPGFPFPMESMRGGWSVEPAFDDEGERRGCVVRVYWEMTPKGGMAGLLGVAIAAPSLDRAMREAVGSMAGRPVRRSRASGQPLPC